MALSHTEFYAETNAAGVANPTLSITSVAWNAGDRVYVIVTGRDEGIDGGGSGVSCAATGLTFSQVRYREDNQGVNWMALFESDIAGSGGTQTVTVSVTESAHTGGLMGSALVVAGDEPTLDASTDTDTGATDTDTPSIDLTTVEATTRRYAAFGHRNRTLTEDSGDGLTMIRENDQVSTGGNIASLSLYYKDETSAGSKNASGTLSAAIDWIAMAWSVYEAGGGGDTALAGSSAGTSTASAVLTTEIALTGSSAGGSTAQGILTTEIALVGSAAGIAAVSGVLTTQIALVGSSDGLASVAGDLTTQIALAGSAAGAATASGVLTVGDTETYAQDAFGGSEATGWGTADVGGDWVHNVSGSFSVADGVGKVTMTNPVGNSRTAWLSTVAALDVDQTVKVKVSALPSSAWSVFSGIRLTAAGTGYHARLSMAAESGANSLNLNIMRDQSTSLVSATLSSREGDPVADTFYNIRFQAEGTSPTTLRAKAWKEGNSEPSSWDVETTDSTSAYQDALAVGLNVSFLTATGTFICSWDDLNTESIGTVADTALAGDSAGTSTASGVLTTQIRLVGSSAGAGTALGALTTQILLAGSASGQAATAAALTTAIRLAGSSAGLSTADADLTTAIRLAGLSAGAATAAGVLGTVSIPGNSRATVALVAVPSASAGAVAIPAAAMALAQVAGAAVAVVGIAEGVVALVAIPAAEVQ